MAVAGRSNAIESEVARLTARDAITPEHTQQHFALCPGPPHLSADWFVAHRGNLARFLNECLREKSCGDFRSVRVTVHLCADHRPKLPTRTTITARGTEADPSTGSTLRHRARR